MIEPESPLPRCHVLYLSGISRAQIAAIVSSVRESPVLTVSDAEEFTKRGGIIQFFVESGKMRFRINARAAKRARLLLSSRLLALADVVDEEPTSVAGLSLTETLALVGPRLIVSDIEHLAINWTRQLTGGKRN